MNANAATLRNRLGMLPSVAALPATQKCIGPFASCSSMLGSSLGDCSYLKAEDFADEMSYYIREMNVAGKIADLDRWYGQLLDSVTEYESCGVINYATAQNARAEAERLYDRGYNFLTGQSGVTFNDTGGADFTILPDPGQQYTGLFYGQQSRAASTTSSLTRYALMGGAVLGALGIGYIAWKAFK